MELPFLLSQPQSGYHLTAQILNKLFGIPTDQVIHSHYSGGREIFRLEELKVRNLLFLVRDPYEQLLSYSKKIDFTPSRALGIRIRDRHKPIDISSSIKYHHSMNLETLNLYHNHPRDKLLVYYEDLILNPEEESRKIAEFYEPGITGKKPWEDYISNIDNVREEALKRKQITQSSFTKGDKDKLTFHYDMALKEHKELLNMLLKPVIKVEGLYKRYDKGLEREVK